MAQTKYDKRDPEGVQLDISRQLRYALRKEKRRNKRHLKGLHQQRTATCVGCRALMKEERDERQAQG
jgi:hypothetical protein